MLKKETHPFNDTYGKMSIKPHTRKLILGSFPASQVVNETPKLQFYYGSSDNKFWNILGEIFENDFSSSEGILEFLHKNQFGVIDIIRACYRKNNSSSLDSDIAIIELEDIIHIIQSTHITDIYTTSQYVTTLLKEELLPVLEWRREVNDEDGFKYEVYTSSLKAIRIFTLFSPSPSALRGIQKGINRSLIDIEPNVLRLNQYRSLLLLPPMHLI